MANVTQLINQTLAIDKALSVGKSVSNATNNITKVVTDPALQQKVQLLTKQLATLRSFNYILIGLVVLLFVVLLFLLWKYKFKINQLVKRGYEWIHLISAGRIKSYLLKHSDYYEIDGQVYIGDESADLIEYGTGMRHKFFFEDSPYQLLFIPSGVRITPPEKAPEYVKKKFESLSPKVIHIKSPMSSRVLDGMLQKSALFGREITKLGKSPLSWLNKNTGIGLILAAIALMMLLSMFFGKH